MIIPSKEEYKDHLFKYSQYAKSASFVDWCSGIVKHRARRIVTLVSDYKPKSAKVLDLGCGIGLTMHILAQEFKNCIGCDLTDESIVATKALLSKVGLQNRVIKYDGKRLPFAANSFDVILSLEVVEHAEKPELMLKEISRVLKRDGILIITAPNKWWPYETHYKLLFLSYLPHQLADLYVRLSGRGRDYDNINSPTYRRFKKTIEKFFITEDLTLKIVREYKRFSLDIERGTKIVFVAKLLLILKSLEATPFFFLSDAIYWMLVRVSPGWAFLGRPKK